MQFRFTPHIAFHARQYGQALEFYQNVMGMQVLDAEENETRLQCGDLTFYVADDASAKLFLAFTVDDLEEASKALREAGCTLQPVGTSGSMVRDPFGLEFFLSAG